MLYSLKIKWVLLRLKFALKKYKGAKITQYSKDVIQLQAGKDFCHFDIRPYLALPTKVFIDYVVNEVRKKLRPRGEFEEEISRRVMKKSKVRLDP